MSRGKRSIKYREGNENSNHPKRCRRWNDVCTSEDRVFGIIISEEELAKYRVVIRVTTHSNEKMAK
jgi:hypothetical protein